MHKPRGLMAAVIKLPAEEDSHSHVSLIVMGSERSSWLDDQIIAEWA